MIRRRGKSWTVSVNVGRDPASGKRQRIWRTVRTKAEAIRLEAQLIAERESGTTVQPGRLTVGQFLQKWLMDYVSPNLAPKTYLTYEQLIRVHVLPSLGSLRLGKLRPLHVLNVYARVLESGRSASTALHVHRVLSEALGHAVKWQLLSRNPCESVEAPRPERREIQVPSPDSLQKILESANETRLGTLINLLLMTGVRIGEATALRWDDLDLDGGLLHVSRTLQWIPRKGPIFRHPKTSRSARVVALSPATVQRLRQHRPRQAEERLSLGPLYKDQGLVFANETGGPIDPSNLRRTWRRITGSAGVKMRLHDLRHACATLLLQRGVNIRVVSDRLGHANTSTTLNTYAHVMLGAQAEAAAQMDELFRATG
jgi:Site-specific recombinase XerD